VIIRKDCPLHRRLLSAIREVLTHKGHGAGSTANGHACGATVLGYNEVWLAVRVERLRVAQLVFLDDAWSGKRWSDGYLNEVLSAQSGRMREVKVYTGISVPAYSG
jgi:hypothetical protein